MMSNQNDTTTEAVAVEDAPAAGDTAASPEEPEAEDTGEAVAGASKEAMRYRRRLRDAEGERDALAGRLEALQRAEVTRLAGERLANGADIFLTGAEVAAMLDEDGNVSADKVAEQADAAVAERPYLAQRVPDFDGGRRGAAPREQRMGAIFAEGSGTR